MKTIRDGSEIIRCGNKQAECRVKDGCIYCPKSEWKKNVRDKGKIKEVKVVFKEDPMKSDKVDRSSKYKSKMARKEN